MRSWGYRCFLTLPQIELMMCDLPHTLYNRKNGKKKVTEKDVADAEALMREAYERKKAKREAEKSYTVDEIFAGEADK